MKELLSEEWLRQVLETARDCRIRQLEPEFVAWEEYRAVEKVKEDILHRLEECVPREGRDMLFQFDDASSLLTGRAQDFFYEKGFADCFRILGRMLAQQLLEHGKAGEQ